MKMGLLGPPPVRIVPAMNFHWTGPPLGRRYRGVRQQSTFTDQGLDVANFDVGLQRQRTEPGHVVRFKEGKTEIPSGYSQRERPATNRPCARPADPRPGQLVERHDRMRNTSTHFISRVVPNHRDACQPNGARRPRVCPNWPGPVLRRAGRAPRLGKRNAAPSARLVQGFPPLQSVVRIASSSASHSARHRMAAFQGQGSQGLQQRREACQRYPAGF